MNQKGMLFIVMTLMMILAIIALNANIMDISREARSLEEISSTISAGSHFKNIKSTLIDLDKNGFGKIVAERAMPFNYEIMKDKNAVMISQELPLSATVLQETFNSLSMLKIFMEDRNYENVFDGSVMDVNVPTSRLAFLMEPFCYAYIIDTNQSFSDTNFSKIDGTQCKRQFQQGDIKRIDINVTINNSNDDYNRLLCNLGSCVYAPCNSSYPYYQITIFDSNCTHCNQTLNNQTMCVQIDDPSNQNLITLEGTISKTLEIRQNNFDFNFFHPSGNSLTISTNIQFSQKPEDFFMLDANFSVEGAGESRQISK